MIKKLKRKIILIIMIPLISIIVGTVIFLTYSHYTSTIRATTMLIERVFGEDNKNEPQIKTEQKGSQTEELEETIQQVELEGFYSFVVKDSEIVDTYESISQEIQNYAIEAANKGGESGIVGDYIYKIRKQRKKDEGVQVILAESKDSINEIKTVTIVALLGLILLVLIIYIIASKITKIIIKPVETTLEKQVQFISDASHELKTPLAVIQANADVLETNQGSSKWLTYIQNEINSMDKLINELLLLAKIENVDSLKSKEEFNLSEQIEMVTSMFESMAYEKQIEIKLNIQENIKMIGDKQDIEHILSTLIDNAIKHTEAKKEIIVEMNKEKEEIEIQVKNIGEAIPKEEREKIFERFYRVDKARNRNEKRYGLGLAIAKSTAEKYKGTISVDYKDGFTIFKVILQSK